MSWNQFNKMMRTIITLVLINTITLAWGSEIGLGFSTNEISVWRYWEKTNNGFSHKILVLNISDKALNIKIQQEVLLGFNFEKDSTQTIIIGENTKIESFEYTIFDVDLILIENKGSDEETKIFKYIVNGENVGATSSEFEKPPIELNNYKYVSYTGLNGGPGFFWIAKNNLFATENQLDSVVLMYKNIGKPIFKEKEQYWITMQPTSNFSIFEISTNGIQKGNYNNISYYEISAPYSSELNPTTTSQIVINFKATKKSKIYLGLICRLWH